MGFEARPAVADYLGWITAGDQQPHS